jgi:CHAT domain-containing protein/tetratricopeptide (TPR) repeat protein
MENTAVTFPQLQEVTSRAQAAMVAGDAAALRAALASLRDLCGTRAEAGGSFDGIVTLQGVLMALKAGDQPLAQQLAELTLADTAPLLEQLNQQYLDAVAKGSIQEARLALSQAYACALTFIPSVLCPEIPWMLQAFAARSESQATPLLLLLHSVVPQLVKADWYKWPYQADLLTRANRGAAQTLILTGNEIMQNASQGALVEQSLHLALNAQALLPHDSRDQLMADLKNLLGQIYMSFGPVYFGDALTCFEDCIAIQEPLGNAAYVARDHSNAGAAALSLSLFEAANGQQADADLHRTRALDHLTVARDYFRAHGSKKDLRDTLVNLGAYYAYFHDPGNAASALQEALGLMDSFDGDEKYYGVKLLGNLGNAYLDTKDYDKANICLDAALKLLQTIPLSEPETDLICYGSKGKLLCLLNHFADAQPYLDQARARLEALRSSFHSEMTSMQLLKNFNWIYEWSIHCLAKLTRWTEAFELAETVKWRSITILLRYLPLGMIDPATEPLIAEEMSLLSELVSAVGEPIEATLLADPAASERLEEIWNTLQPRYPEYVALRRQKTVSAPETANLLDAQVPVLVEYYFGDESGASLAFVIRKAGATAAGVTLPAAKPAIFDLIKQLRGQTDEKPVSEFQRISQELYRILIEPLLPHLCPGEGICFVPYGEMHNLPFATLFEGQKYLVEDHATVIAPSASALRWWVGKDRHQSANCLIFTATSGIREGEQKLADLYLFRHLAESSILPLFSKRQSLVSLPATKASLIEALAGEWDVAHIACHGVALRDGLKSSLVMGGSPDVPDKDLSASDIATQVRCCTTLVTLSACDSAVAETSTGDDVAGLAQSFLIAGSSSVLASNAYVRQDAGVAVTGDFYRCWTGKNYEGKRYSKLQSLQLAQLAAKNKREWFGIGPHTWHPQQWGVFQLYGSWQ